MPNFDGTGPNGLGPAYGKGRGKCRGQGCRFGYRQTKQCPFWRSNAEENTQQNQLEALKSYKKELEAKIKELEKEIK